jgi:Pyruvate/2-oxoacid:ferredoxin oxidoreductase delta subunit
MGICTIDLPVCTGCELCAQVCPWQVIAMVPSEEVVQVPEFAEMLS